MKYELWLDESGDFKSDISGDVDTPSIVGGVLIPIGVLDVKKVQEILEEASEDTPEAGKKWMHSTSMNTKYYGEIAINGLSSARELGAHFVVFENKEKVKIVNSDLTYLHILSEGIIQLFQTLGIQHDEIQLDIYPARRVKTDHIEFLEEGILNIIEPKEYKERLQEKIDLGYARRSMRPNKNKWKWELKTGSAREDYRLMLADIVCHSWYRQKDSRKFSDKQRELLQSLFNPSFLFTTVENTTVASINRYLSEGAIGEALYEWILVEVEWGEHEETSENLLLLMLKRLQQLPDFAQQTQLSIVLSHLKTLIQLERNFLKAKHYLLKIQDQVIPAMRKEKMDHYEFFFDVHLMLLTNATHQGDVELSEGQMLLCRTYLTKMTRRWESFDAVLDYFVRESVHLMNSYDFFGVVKSMNQLENLLENTIDLFPLALQDELNIDIEKMNADIYGKVIGTRLQAHIFLSRIEREHIELARNDSKKAIVQFVNESDLSRQYQYISQIECEAGNFNDSLQWLGKSVGLIEGTEANIVLENILLQDKSVIIFGLMHYTRLMAEAAIQEDFLFAKKLYEAWRRRNVEGDILKNYPNQHPYQIILWKLATYLMLTDSTKAAIKRYGEAEAICVENSCSWTLYSISLAIKSEEIFYLAKKGKKYTVERKRAEKRLQQNYYSLSEKNLPRAMREFFSGWGSVLELEQFEDERIIELSRSIGY